MSFLWSFIGIKSLFLCLNFDINSSFLTRSFGQRQRYVRKSVSYREKCCFFSRKFGFYERQEGIGEVRHESMLTCQTIEIGLKNGMSKDLSARGEAVLNSSMSCTVKCNFFQRGLKIMILGCFLTKSDALISILVFKFNFDLNFSSYSINNLRPVGAIGRWGAGGLQRTNPRKFFPQTKIS